MTFAAPTFAHPYRVGPGEPAGVAPFEAAEVRAAILRPHRAIDLVLAQHPRLARTVAEARHLGPLTAMMLLATVALPLPYGAVLGLDRPWRVSALLLASVLVCFPSLHVFSSYLGCRMSVAQNLALGLVPGSVASLFLLGFAPIAWFVRVTTPAGSAAVAWVSIALLVAALLAGMLHLGRCVAADPTLRPAGRYRLLLLCWQGLFAYVAYRMGVYLELP